MADSSALKDGGGRALAGTPVGVSRSSTLVRALRALLCASLLVPAALLGAAAYQEWEQLHATAEQRARNTAAIL